MLKLFSQLVWPFDTPPTMCECGRTCEGGCIARRHVWCACDVCVCVYACACLRVCTWAWLCACVCSVSVWVFMYVACKYMCLCAYRCVWCMCEWAYMYVYTCVAMCGLCACVCAHLKAPILFHKVLQAYLDCFLHKPVTSPRSPVSFYWRMMPDTNIWILGVLVTGMFFLSQPLNGQSKNYPRLYGLFYTLHIYKCSAVQPSIPTWG